MNPWRVVLIVPVVAIGVAVAADRDPVPLYTSDDLDRMFGPAPAQPSDPVDKTRPEDWRWIEEFLDRQYSRIEADRQFDLSSRSVDIADQRIEARSPVYGQPASWGLGYPASTWWNTVASKYAVGVRAAPFHSSIGGFARATCHVREHDHRSPKTQR